MDAGGYSSDPTTATSASSRSFGRNINDDEEHHHAPSFSSLHSRAHLQSTPAKTAQSGNSASRRLLLHRVDRAGATAIVQSSASESQSQTDEEEEEQGDMEDNATELGEPRAAGTKVREYWGRLLQEAEENKSTIDRQDGDRLGQLGVPAGRRQPPSTGSSTLVDQESLTGSSKRIRERVPSTTLERPASAPPVAYDNTTPGPSRPSPLQDHISRFLSSTPSDPYVPARPPSPPSLSHQDVSRISTHNNTSSSAIASRVHDIFAKHIHSASTSSTARQPVANRSTDRRLPPRQRLRDLLGESNPNNSRHSHSHTRTTSSQQTYTSESEGESIQEPQRPYRHSSAAAARTSPRRRREGSNTPRAGPSQRLISKLPDTSASTSRGRIDLANESQARGSISTDRANEATSQRHSPNGSRTHMSRPNHSRRISGSIEEREIRPDSPPARRESRSNTNQLSREWDSIRQQEQSRQYEEALDHIQGTPQDEEERQMDPSELEYRSSEVEEEARQVQMYTQSDSDPGYSPESELDRPQRIDVQDSRGRSAELGPAEEEEASSVSQSEREDERQASYVQQQRISPRLGTLSSFRQSTNSEASAVHDEDLHGEVVQIATSTPRAASRTLNRSFGNSTRAPKTPHPPGAYFSTTPSTTLVGGSPSRRQVDEHSFVEHRGNETGEASRSRFLGGGNYSVAPKIPGGYSSPFPQPRKGVVQRNEPDAVRFSTPSKSRLAPQTSNSASPSRVGKALSTLGDDGSPARLRESPRSEFKHSSPRDWSTSTKPALSIPPSTPTKVKTSPQGTPRSRTQSGETTLQTMFTDLVKPLKNLLVGLHTPPKPVSKAITSTLKVKEEKECFLDNEDTLVERKKRRLEHDHILARLSEADRIDRSLATRIDDMRKAVDEMGQRLSSQVSSVLAESFVQEAKRRKLWFSLLIILQLLLLYLIFIYANARANQLYQTTYFDPFFPALLDPHYHESRSFLRTSHLLYSSSSSFSFSSGTPLGTHIRDSNESWYHAFSRVFQYALYAMWDNLGLGGRTDFMHGTFLQDTVTKVVTAAASDTTAIFRIPT